MRVYISHAPEDAEIARRLYDDLNRTPGVQPWMAEPDLLPGQNRQHEIGRAIRECHYFIPILSSQSVSRSGAVHKEIRRAIDILDETPDGTIFMIPVRADDCHPAHDRLAEIRPADLFPEYDAGLAQIRRSLKAGEGDGAGDETETEKPPRTEPPAERTEPVISDADKKERLAVALMECRALKDGRTRKQIADCLDDMAGRIEAEGPPGTVVREMVSLCWDYPDGIDRLMACVERHEKGSIPFAEARRVRKEIQGNPGNGGSGRPPADEPETPGPPPPPAGTPPDQPEGEPADPPGASGPPEAPATGGGNGSPSNSGTNPEPPGPQAETWEKVLAFIFGVVFVSVMLVVAVFIPNPTPFQQWLFRVVLALAAAGVGAVVPGMINVEWKDPKIRAAGAFALFVIVYLLNPPEL